MSLVQESTTTGREGDASPLRAHGRSLADFGELSTAEHKLLSCCHEGTVAVIAEGAPDEEVETNSVRAGFVRFLILGGGPDALVHEHGVQLQGAWLSGILDLKAVKADHPIWLSFCRVERIEAQSGVLKSLNLNGCRLANGLAGEGLRCSGPLSMGSEFRSDGLVNLSGATIEGRLDCEGGRFETLYLDGARIDGSVFLRDGFHATGTVRLVNATINGVLDCSGGRFDCPQDVALNFDRLVLSGGVFLRNGFRATGEVRLLGATIGGDLTCTAGRFDNGEDDALSCHGAMVSGYVYLRNGFHSTGGVCLMGATIGRDLECSGGQFENLGGVALACTLARITGTLYFQRVNRISGGVDLSSAHTGSLSDDGASWEGAHGSLTLDNFTYERLADGAPTDAAARIAWLDHQSTEDLGSGFKPQPWEQLIAVLRAMGHSDEAREVAIEKQKRLRRNRRLPRGIRPFHWLYGALVGYGYRPLRLFTVTAAVWLLCALAYWWATNPGALGPTTHLLAHPGKQASTAAPDYRNFVPLIYSADVLLPVVDLGYKDEWQPVVSKAGKPLLAGQLLRFLYWFEIAFGWVAGLLLVGVLGNLIKKD